MLKKWVPWIIAVVLFGTAGSLFFINRATEDYILGKNIEELAKSGLTEIALSPLTDFDWDQAMVYGPYTTEDQIENSLNIKFKGSTHGIEVLEDRFLLVFAKGNHAVKTTPLSRMVGDYSEKSISITPENDVLVVVKE
ncbi:hypothetical protein DV702_08375 [Sporosarcina sp. PTS2304]|uniref:hypothetical protein n=1 Tax=Sporosarcina sp. PTS2304 TaxID=2283194 RepID=UPI000E0DE9B4|nr:hypothetical protein [Sporosarcina sp. PTS2304]AXH99746.1 hypothetical protein DV702_08375 [Sporosarcina sp. PTS2304]